MTDGLSKLVGVFKNPSFRVYFTGQFISLTGTWLQRIAESWLAWELTHSAFYLGLVGFMGLFPGIFSNLFAGALLDRYSRKSIIITAQILLLAEAGLLCFFTLTGNISIGLLLVLSSFQAFVAGADMPARQTFLSELTDRDSLPQAIALNSVMVNLGRILGPAAGAILIPLAGVGWAFGMNAATYLVILISMFWVHPITAERPAHRQGLLGQIREGFQYVFQNKTLRNYLLLFGSCNLLGMFYSSLLPLFADEKFHEGARGLALLTGASGLGAFTGAILLGTRVRPDNLKRVLKAGTALLAVSLLMMAIVPWFFLALGVLFFGGLGMMIQIAGTNTLLQLETSDTFRGRVMSIYTFTFTLGTPIGALWAGSLAEKTIPELPFLVGGLLLSIFLFLFTRNGKGPDHA